MNKKLIIPGIAGNILEWYDFSLYGYFAPVIAHLFFPTHNEFLSLLSTFGVFAMGFLMRPLGAVIFGYYGDRVGRKKTLAFAVVLMALPTTIMGLLPTYDQVGIAAGIALTACRLLQGLAVGGEFTGSIVYITEHAPQHRRGFFGSWAMFSAFVGLLLGSFVSALVTLMPEEQMIAWGWRIPFVMGLALGFIGLYLRWYMPETPTFRAIKKKQQTVQNPVLHAFRYSLKPMVYAAGLVFLPSLGFYTIFVYLSSYMTTYLDVSLNTALSVNTVSMLGIILVIPVIGLLSDKIGRRPVLMTGAIGFILLSYPLFLLLQQGTFIAMLFVQVCFAVLVAFSYAAVPAALVELMATDVRYTAMSFPYNVSNAVFGGTAPLVATWLIGVTGDYLSPSFYLILTGLITLTFVYFIHETYRVSLRRSTK